MTDSGQAVSGEEILTTATIVLRGGNAPVRFDVESQFALALLVMLYRFFGMVAAEPMCRGWRTSISAGEVFELGFGGGRRCVAVCS